MPDADGTRPLAVTLGDPAGIGPELICLAWARRRDERLAPFFVVGGAGVLATAARLRGLNVPIRHISHPDEAPTVFAAALPVLGGADCAVSFGTPTEDGARLALHSLAAATALTKGGEAAALVTAPVAKDALAQIGFAHPGQTEYLADACGLPAEAAVMMLAGPSLRAVPLTIHCALVEVAARLTTAHIAAQARIVAAALQRDFGLARPRIAVCGLNPHAGENGRFGLEERDIITPAIALLQAEGLDVTGPHPADALFTPRARAGYDVALAMYHDQALIPVKALDFDEGVNVTLGLPIVRTSPDHGTAFDIAGVGRADPGAFLAALRMAADCARRRSASDG